MPLAGLVWRTETEYQRNEPCRPANPDLPTTDSAAESSARSESNVNAETSETCAVLLTNLSLVRVQVKARA